MFGNEYITLNSVKAVEEFLNKGVPLSETIAEVAKADRLNSDQVRRLIEATNQITHLKLMQTQEDRTTEFPVASYEEVMGSIMPAEKQASVISTALDKPLTLDTSLETGWGNPATTIELPVVETEESIEKAASKYYENMSEDERLQHLYVESTRAKGRLEKLAEQRQLVLADIERNLMSIRKDESGLKKIARVCTDSMSRFGLSDLLVGKEASMEKLAEAMTSDDLFTEAELKTTKDLHSLYKQAKILSDEYSNLEAFVKKADEIFTMKKQAFLGKMINRAIVKPAVSVGKFVGKTIGNGVVSPNSLGGAALGVTMLNPNPAKDVWANLHPSKPSFPGY